MNASTVIRAGRDYAALIRGLQLQGDRAARMQGVVDVLWAHLGGGGGGGGGASSGVSWVGFYTKVAGQDEMLLGARRDKPACSPIGLHGACGRCWASRKSLVVTDVSRLGAGYIACDPRDKSEVVVPLFELDGTCWGVLDADSYDVNAFTRADAEGLAWVLVAAGLSAREPDGVEII